jgi:hypothetical protein
MGTHSYRLQAGNLARCDREVLLTPLQKWLHYSGILPVLPTVFNCDLVNDQCFSDIY